MKYWVWCQKNANYGFFFSRKHHSGQRVNSAHRTTSFPEILILIQCSTRGSKVIIMTIKLQNNRTLQYNRKSVKQRNETEIKMNVFTHFCFGSFWRNEKQRLLLGNRLNDVNLNCFHVSFTLVLLIAVANCMFLQSEIHRSLAKFTCFQEIIVDSKIRKTTTEFLRIFSWSL